MNAIRVSQSVIAKTKFRLGFPGVETSLGRGGFPNGPFGKRSLHILGEQNERKARG